MKDKRKYTHCSECGEELGDRYYTFRENHIQTLFFNEIDNAFCSLECAANFVMLVDLPNRGKSINGIPLSALGHVAGY